jgi:hypothetical protein
MRSRSLLGLCLVWAARTAVAGDPHPSAPLASGQVRGPAGVPSPAVNRGCICGSPLAIGAPCPCHQPDDPEMIILFYTAVAKGIENATIRAFNGVVAPPRLLDGPPGAVPNARGRSGAT